ALDVLLLDQLLQLPLDAAGQALEGLLAQGRGPGAAELGVVTEVPHVRARGTALLLVGQEHGAQALRLLRRRLRAVLLLPLLRGRELPDRLAGAAVGVLDGDHREADAAGQRTGQQNPSA